MKLFYFNYIMSNISLSEHNLTILCNIKSSEKILLNENKLDIQNSNQNAWFNYSIFCNNNYSIKEIENVIISTLLNNIVPLEIVVKNNDFSNFYKVRLLLVQKVLKNLEELMKENKDFTKLSKIINLIKSRLIHYESVKKEKELEKTDNLELESNIDTKENEESEENNSDENSDELPFYHNIVNFIFGVFLNTYSYFTHMFNF